MRRDARPLVGVLILAALLLTGCGGLPTSGPVEAGEPIQAQEDERSVNVGSFGPRDGDDEVDIVGGFLANTGSYEPGYRVAREYLTQQAGTQWDPFSLIQVYDASVDYGLTKIGPGQVALTAPVVATVDAQGTYRTSPPGQTTEIDVSLEQVDGQWRISAPPSGLLLSTFDFNREFASYDVFFFDPSGDVLVPDQVVLPARGTQSTLLVGSLLDGPSSWLAPAVRTAFPDGTQLGIQSVSIEEGIAQVELTAQAKTAATIDKTRMAAQLAATLKQVPGVTSVAIQADGAPLVIPGSPDGVVEVATPSADPSTPAGASTVYAVRDGAVVTVLGDATQPVGGVLGTGQVRARSVGVSLDMRRAAVVDETGRTLLVGGFEGANAPVPAASGTDLSAPTWDRTGLVWVADRTGSVSRLLVSDGARADVVTGVDLSGSWVESVRMSPDGVRLLMVVRSEGRTKLLVGLVRRPEGDTVTAGIQLVSTREVPLDFSSVADAVWADTQKVSVLGGLPDAPAEPYVVDISGATAASQGVVVGAVSLAAAPDKPLVIGTADGELQLRSRETGQWTVVGQGALPTYPG